MCSPVLLLKHEIHIIMILQLCVSPRFAGCYLKCNLFFYVFFVESDQCIHWAIILADMSLSQAYWYLLLSLLYENLF